MINDFAWMPLLGNHGEDVKELYYYQDSSPTHSYMKSLYKYSHKEYPYSWLIEENRRRGVHEPEFELLDTGLYIVYHSCSCGMFWFLIFIINQERLNSGSVLVQVLRVSEVCDGENIWRLSRLEIRLNFFCWSTIPQEEFIIIINSACMWQNSFC